MPDPDMTADGRGRLTEALALLIQSQATQTQTQAALTQNLVARNQNQTALLAQLAEIRRELAAYRRETDERFDEILRVLAEHGRLLEQLPAAIRGQFGFRPPGTD
jgi:hypothetical protein